MDSCSSYLKLLSATQTLELSTTVKVKWKLTVTVNSGLVIKHQCRTSYNPCLASLDNYIILLLKQDEFA